MDKCVKFKFIWGDRNDNNPYKITPGMPPVLDIYSVVTVQFAIMNDACRFSRNHVVECSEKTVLSCLEPVCLC